MKAVNRQVDTEVLVSVLGKLGLRSTLHNDGQHVILYDRDGRAVYDYFPSTESWLTRDGARGNGLGHLLDHVSAHTDLLTSGAAPASAPTPAVEREYWSKKTYLLVKKLADTWNVR